MNTYAAFGVGLGNLGKSSRPRIEQSAWIDVLNRELTRVDGPNLLTVGAYGHTGNFVLRSAGNREAVQRALSRALETGCAVLALTELKEIVEHLGVRPVGACGKTVDHDDFNPVGIDATWRQTLLDRILVVV